MLWAMALRAGLLGAAESGSCFCAFFGIGWREPAASCVCCQGVACCLPVLLPLAGITVNQLQTCGGGGEQLAAGAFLPAALCVLGSVTVPSAASVLNEKGLKRHMDTSVHLQNFFLYFYGMLFNLCGVLVMCLVRHQSFASIFEHQTWVTYTLVVNNALQGILSSFFYKVRGCLLRSVLVAAFGFLLSVQSFLVLLVLRCHAAQVRACWLQYQHCMAVCLHQTAPRALLWLTAQTLLHIHCLLLSVPCCCSLRTPSSKSTAALSPQSSQPS